MPVTRTITQTLYTFEELSEASQQAALERLWDINVNHDWWEYIYEDAADIGLRIDGFDLHRNTIEGTLTEELPAVVNAIFSNHGERCDTWQTAVNHLAEYRKAAEEWRAREWKGQDYDKFGNSRPADDELLRAFGYEDESSELHQELKRALLEDYFAMLRQEYDYQTSKEQVGGAIVANEYMFDEDGNLA